MDPTMMMGMDAAAGPDQSACVCIKRLPDGTFQVCQEHENEAETAGAGDQVGVSSGSASEPGEEMGAGKTAATLDEALQVARNLLDPEGAAGEDGAQDASDDPKAIWDQLAAERDANRED